jgi:hypothetical protein
LLDTLGGQPHVYVFGEVRVATLALLTYYAVGTALLRRRYRQILGPCPHFPKFSNRVCGYPEIFVCLNSHLIWQAAKGDVERGSALGLISHKGLPYCPEQPTISLRRGRRAGAPHAEYRSLMMWWLPNTEAKLRGAHARLASITGQGWRGRSLRLVSAAAAFLGG